MGGETIRKATIDLVRENNRALILRALRRGGAQSRTALGQVTGLSPAAISGITSAMLDEGVLLQADGESGTAKARGRPQVKLSLNPLRGCVVAVMIAVNRIRLKLVDYAGKECTESHVDVAALEMQRGEFIRTIGDAVFSLLDETLNAAGPLSRIEVSVQGITDGAGEKILWSPVLRAREIDLARRFSRRFGVPVSVMNDCAAMTEALQWIDPPRYRERFAAILIGYGVGMGLFLDGAPLVGLRDSAVEFGHMNHVPEGALCRCGRRGCVEAYAADYAIWRRAKGKDDQKLVAPPSAEEMALIEDRARQGNEQALAAYREAGCAIGFGLGRLFALIGPVPVAFTGSGTRTMDLLEEGLRDGFEQSLVEDLRGELVFETLGDEAALVFKGLAMGALNRLDTEDIAALQVSS
ncbi:ROK family protein [Pelagibius sp. Alg239-R121]|uniref:ROK family protein n=1 Tax=Pelagibius sp. Alg239-R121 TaxID=2993448 RepID=UPI0024A610D8|nr:ROK family protein [Pelagibius sp. Alg239-R121]